LPKKSVDLLLFLDCTGSMDHYISETSRILINLITELQMKLRGYEFRVAFLGYRDFGDECLEQGKFSKFDFTTDYHAIKMFI